MRYRGTSFGPEYRENLFSAQFNPHRLQRHILSREGATFRTEDTDFLTSVDPDFHPTDVMEDADGSLLVVDTGAWFYPRMSHLAGGQAGNQGQHLSHSKGRSAASSGSTRGGSETFRGDACRNRGLARVRPPPAGPETEASR